MHKLYFFLLCAILCASCSKKYKIEGTSSVSMLDGKMLFIKIPVGNQLMNIDSAEVIHGLFKMQGKVLRYWPLCLWTMIALCPWLLSRVISTFR